MQRGVPLAVTVTRWIGLLGASLWAGVHLVLAAHVAFPGNLTATEVYSIFFGFTSALAIVTAVVFLLGIKNLYLPSLIFYVIDLALLTETRTAPALFVGKVLPVNFYVEISWLLDVLLIIVSAVLWKIDK